MADSPLADWLESVKPDEAMQRIIVDLLNESIGQCIEPDCSHAVLLDPDYACFFCYKAYCLAEHMAYVNLLEKYCYDFLEAADHPDAEYVCSACLARVDAEYEQWLETPHMLRDWFHWKFARRKENI